MKPPSAQVGFTLVELLVALLITVLLAGSAAAILRSVAGARQVVADRLHAQQEATVALRIIATALRNAYRPVSDNDVLFEGDQQRGDPIPLSRVRFRAVDRRLIRPGQSESDVHDIEFFIRDTGTAATLMRRTDPAHKPSPARGGVVEPIALDVVGLDVQYFDAGKWLDHWSEARGQWPTAIKVRLVYMADAATHSLGSVSRLVNFPYWQQPPPRQDEDQPAQGGNP